MSTNENAFANGEWRGGRFYPHGSQSDFASTLAERAERQRQESGIEPGDDLDELPARPPKSIPDADLQLLDLAARALGAVRVETVEGEQWVNLHFEDGSTTFGWNPLRHSDDALALAVRLGILEQAGAELDLSYNQIGDELANARYAIAHIAARIGKQHSYPK